MVRYTVSELTTELAQWMATEFAEVCVEGEISGFKPHSSGHWYFSLKDERALLSCAMFRGDNMRVRRPPRDGDRVVLYGRMSIYPPRGTYSLIASKLEPAGSGDLLRRLELLREKLAAEGLFDPAKKRRLPAFPRAIGVVTSPTGAALQDVLRVVRQRFPAMTVYVAPCRVQGEGAAAEIVRALGWLVQHGKSDVIIVGRGGGSQEDLWAFNEEPVVRAVAACTIPTVSAVGHEVDITLCDFAADVRAATPSHSAELVTPVAAELRALVEEREERLDRAMRRRVEVARERLRRLRLLHPRDRVARARLRCDELDERLRAAVERALRRRRDRLAAGARHLDALSPLAVLTRGYTLATRDGHPVRDAATLTVGDTLRLRFAGGAAKAQVTAVEPAEEG